MILNQIVDQASKFLSHNNDNAVDKLHYRHTVLMLSIYLLMITSKIYFGDPIVCHLGSVATAEARRLVESQCWLNGTHKFSSAEIISQKRFDEDTRIHYYQWIVIVLVFQCFLFSIPNSLWDVICSFKGFNLSNVAVTVSKVYDQNKDWKETQKMLQTTSDLLRISVLRAHNDSRVDDRESNLTDDIRKHPIYSDTSNSEQAQTQHERARKRRHFPNLRSRARLPLYLSYIGVKLLQLANVLFQYLLLSKVFKFNYLEYGFNEIKRVIYGGKYNYENEYFPKNSLCITYLLNLINLNNNTVLCSLPLNLFHEMFYAIFWVWLAIIFVFTFTDLLFWLRFVPRGMRKRFVKSKMQIQWDQFDRPSTSLATFYLGQDGKTVAVENTMLMNTTGLSLEENFNLFFQHVCSLDLVLVTKLLATNTSNLVTKDLLLTLWYEYLDVNTTSKSEQMQMVRRPDLKFSRMPFQRKQLQQQSFEANEEKV